MGNTITRWPAAASGAVRWASLSLWVALIGAVLAASAAPAQGQEDQRAVKKIIELNKKALVQIDAKKFDAARDGLLQAVTTATQANLLAHKMLARTYVHLGAVYFLGYQDSKSAVKYFGLAKNIRADILLTPSLATPDLTALFDKALADKGQADDQWGDAAKSGPHVAARAPAPTPAPAPAPAAPTPPVVRGIPELPAVLPSDLYCPAVEEAPEGREIVLRCAVNPKLKAERVLLYYRASGAPTYTAAAMQISPEGWLEASIPEEAATGESMQYYCEARDADDNVVATNGQEDIPNPIILTPAVPGETPVGRQVATSGKGDGDDPLKRIKDEQKSEIRELDLHRRRKGAFWLAPGSWNRRRLSLGLPAGMAERPRCPDLRRWFSPGGYHNRLSRTRVSHHRSHRGCGPGPLRVDCSRRLGRPHDWLAGHKGGFWHWARALLFGPGHW